MMTIMTMMTTSITQLHSNQPDDDNEEDKENDKDEDENDNDCDDELTIKCDTTWVIRRHNNQMKIGVSAIDVEHSETPNIDNWR